MSQAVVDVAFILVTVTFKNSSFTSDEFTSFETSFIKATVTVDQLSLARWLILKNVSNIDTFFVH